ncbi:hypothetical protein COCON_G00187710 [Conger conger]|uniref:Solute carrier family 13 member 5 n=1 Tax=Conger conger TaxID=82655 RepID=A0A9Q1D3J2_CONCO|nr:hypothetical protein COCON_G00187710 [Conger conger]
MAVYWCTEALPMAVTALLPVVLFPVFGIMRSREVSIQYLNDTTMLCLGTLVVALAVEHWNLHKRLALRMLYLTGVRPPLLMLSFMCVTAFLSMWTNTMAASAMITPIVQAVLQQLHYREEERGEEQRELVMVNGSGVYEETVPFEEAAEKRRICKGMKLSVCYAASIGGTATLTATGANLVLQGQMNQLFPTNGDVITFTSWFTFAFPNMIIMLFISWFWLQFIAMGLNFRKTWGCGVRRSEEEVAMFRVVRDELRQLGSISFGEGSVLVLFLLLILLWFTRDPGFTTGWARSLLGNNAGYVNDATVAVFIAVLMFILPSQPPRLSLFFPCPHTESQTSPVPPVLLNWKVVQAKMPWDLLLLLGGGFALAKGCEVSGLSRWMGIQMTPLQTIPPWATVIILCLLISIFTEFTSNVAAVTLFLPILASMSQSFGLNPLYLIVPCTLSASFAFMLPVATPVNAIVFSYGDLQASDMAKAGIGMNIIGILCCTLAINTWGRAVFILDSFPTWANITSEAGCAYVILLMAVYWCTEALPMAVTALLPVVLFPVFGIMRSREVGVQYLNDATMLLLGTLVVAVAVEHWNLHKRIALRVLYLAGLRPPLLMLGFMCVTAFLSMWISNTATTAMMVPIIQAVLQQLHYREEEVQEHTPVERVEEQRELVVVNGLGVYKETVPIEEAAEKRRICKGMMLSVCYAASIGGTATLTGTGANLVLQGQMNHFAFPNMILMLFISWFWLQFMFMGLNFRKTWGCGVRRSEEEEAMFRVVRDELRQLGPISFGEGSVLVLFLLLILLWFTRDPSFTTGWARRLLSNDAG